jgi:nitrile hydratase
MNGIHDMGGMQDMCPIQYEKNEPVFHARWEEQVYALDRAMSAWRKWNIDACGTILRRCLRPTICA